VAQDRAVESIHAGRPRSEEPFRILGDRAEDEPHVGLRAADDSQDFRGGRLGVEGLGHLVVARLELREVPRVLDGDDRLIREALEELDLIRWDEGLGVRSTLRHVEEAGTRRGVQ
jgi:hypothetical protein